MIPENSEDFPNGIGVAGEAVSAGNDFFTFCPVEMREPVGDNPVATFPAIAFSSISNDGVEGEIRAEGGGFEHLVWLVVGREGSN